MNGLIHNGVFQRGLRLLHVVLRRIPKLDNRGFSLFEAMAAVGIVGVTVIGSMTLMSVTVNTANRSEGNVKLLQLVRSQIENMKHFEFQDDPAKYPLITGIPEGIAVTFEVKDAEISYTRPDGTEINNVIQKITVTGTELEVVASITFYKLDTR